MNHTTRSTRARTGTISRLIVLCLLSGTLAVPAGAQSWQGKEETKNGITHVLNPAEPYSAPVTASAKELWRAGGEDDEEVLFGVVTQIASDERGNVFVLDAQLNQVVVFSPDGEYLRAIGREGEGPGEFRRPSDIFLTPEGNIAVMQRMPGRIVVLTPEGEPVGDLPVPEPEDGGMQMFGGGASGGSLVVLNVSRFSRREAAFSTVTSLVAVDPEGRLAATFHERREEADFANMVFDEKKMGPGALVWSVGPDGRVYTSDDFDAYRIRVWNTDGSPARVIETDYAHRKRSPEEMKRNAPIVRIRQGDRTQSPQSKPSETDRDILRIFPRENGDIWVLTSKGAFETPKGSIATFDVLDSEGKFVRRITLGGRGSLDRDGAHIVGDRLYVTTGLVSARAAMLGVGEGDAPEGEEEPMSVICYGLNQTSAR